MANAWSGKFDRSIRHGQNITSSWNAQSNNRSDILPAHGEMVLTGGAKHPFPFGCEVVKPCKVYTLPWWQIMALLWPSTEKLLMSFIIHMSFAICQFSTERQFSTQHHPGRFVLDALKKQ